MILLFDVILYTMFTIVNIIKWAILNVFEVFDIVIFEPVVNFLIDFRNVDISTKEKVIEKFNTHYGEIDKLDEKLIAEFKHITGIS